MEFPGTELGETWGGTGFGGKPEFDFGPKFQLSIIDPRRALSWQLEIHPPSLV